MAPLFVSRVPTVYSLQQLEEEYATPQKGAVSHPLKPVGDLASSLLPRLACLSCTTAAPSKRIRSFGDLQAIVPDSDEDRCEKQPASRSDILIKTSSAQNMSCGHKDTSQTFP